MMEAGGEKRKIAREIRKHLKTKRGRTKRLKSMSVHQPVDDAGNLLPIKANEYDISKDFKPPAPDPGDAQ